ncbi:MAG: hypothetical protein WC742_13955 [Gallionellaceae bacterium]|jgi:hypothetical protein
MKYKLNIFAAWVLIPHVLAMGWVAFIGRMLLELAGVSTLEEGIPGRLVGLLFVIGAVTVINHVRGSLWPVGNPEGSGFVFGQRIILAANLLAFLLLSFELTKPLFTDLLLISVLAKFTDAFGYWVMAMWAIGLSFIYQSTLLKSVKTPS